MLSKLLLASALTFLASAHARAQERDVELITPARRWALVVGAGRYEHLGRLSYAAGDARAFAGALEGSLGFERDTIRMLVDDAEEPELQPTAGHLLGELEALLADRRRTRSDLFVFYFCGHGVGRPEGDFLLPTDARRETATRVGLPVREVVERLSSAGMRNVLVVVDACRTGSENPFGTELWALAAKARLALVLGCEPGGQSYEDALIGHGIFTHALVEALADPTLVDASTGALWASRVASAAAARVSASTARREPPQRPAVWNDPTQDILLALRPGEAAVGPFLGETGKLAPEARLAACARYAQELYFSERLEECVELLRALEQLGDLPPELGVLAGFSLQGLGRSVESARAFQGVRTGAPSTELAALATLGDRTGVAALSERAEAARFLWDQGAPVNFDLLVVMVQALADGGLGALALEVARTALTQAPPDTRDEAYLRAEISNLEGSGERALEELALAETRPGSFPSDRQLREHRVQLTFALQGFDAARALLDESLARSPEEGSWYAWRAWLGRNAAKSQAELVPVRADAHAALQRELLPETLLMATRAAGMQALEERERIEALAARHPLAWQAQIAAVFARGVPDSRAAVADVARLAARPALVYSTFASLMLDAMSEDADRILEERGSEPGVREELVRQVRERYQQALERLVPMAGDVGTDPDVWRFLADSFVLMGLREPCARLFERHLGPLADAQRLPDDLLASYLAVALNAGRDARAEALLAQLNGPGALVDAMHWLAAAGAMVAGDEAGVRARLGGRETVIDPANESLRRPVLAWLRARAGDAEGARALLGEADPKSSFSLALTGFVAHALGDVERARASVAALETRDASDAYFAQVALWRAVDGEEPLDALRAALSSPGNPLTRTFAFARGLAAFEGVQELVVAEAPGPVAAVGATLTLTIKSSGRVLGALELVDGAVLPLTGTLDEFGNLTGELRAPAGTLSLLAKLAPPGFARSFDPLANTGQMLHLLDAAGVAYPWRALAKE
jgi:caspase domain-containing protein